MNVEGKQFYWQITYPNGVIAIDTMRAPVNRPVRVEVTAPENDVIHSWWIPALGGRFDAIPGHPNHTWYEVEKPGTYKGQCAEFCGIQHAAMTATVQAVPARKFDSWLSAQARAQEAGPPTSAHRSSTASAPSATATWARAGSARTSPTARSSRTRTASRRSCGTAGT